MEAWLTGVCGCAVLLLCAVARLPQVGHLEVLQLIAEHSGDLDASDKRGRFRLVCFVCFALFCLLCLLCLFCFVLLCFFLFICLFRFAGLLD